IKAKAAIEAKELSDKGILPKLTVILVGNNPASAVYVNGKAKDCAQCGILSDIIAMDENTTQSELLNKINELNNDAQVNGILVQLPLPKHINEAAIIEAISPIKDVDGFTPVNAGRMLIGEDCYLPCTPAGCMELLRHTGVDIAGKDAIVIGRSNIVGKPAAILLTQANATVTLAHSRTHNLKAKCLAADIIIAAVGKAGFVTGDMVKDGAIVIDVGINRGEDGKLYGDVNYAQAEAKASFITPVPGGVGLMTRAMLMLNTIKAAKRQNNIN
ncbi:MAG: tetrahydrofolate dehydrogenase/cyclohydrolase catalytic domain-containing protein, partial [Oscillospiraceae bacterium]